MSQSRIGRDGSKWVSSMSRSEMLASACEIRKLIEAINAMSISEPLKRLTCYTLQARVDTYASELRSRIDPSGNRMQAMEARQ